MNQQAAGCLVRALSVPSSYRRSGIAGYGLGSWQLTRLWPPVTAFLATASAAKGVRSERSAGRSQVLYRGV